MVGIWVLNRGKLAPPPPQISQQPPPVQLPFSLPLSLPSLSGVTPPYNTQPMFLPHAPSPAIPGLASLSAAISSAIPAPPLPTLKSIEPATLAAEVASLTPEQISLMMEALRKTVNLAPPPPAPAPAPGPQPGPSHFPPYPQQPINQPWPQSIPGFLASNSPGNPSAPPPNGLGPPRRPSTPAHITPDKNSTVIRHPVRHTVEAARANAGPAGPAPAPAVAVEGETTTFDGLLTAGGPARARTWRFEWCRIGIARTLFEERRGAVVLELKKTSRPTY